MKRNNGEKKCFAEIGEKTVLVKYDFQPEEKQTRNYPGCPASITVNQVIFGGKDVLDLLTDEEKAIVEDAAWENLVAEAEYEMEMKYEQAYGI